MPQPKKKPDVEAAAKEVAGDGAGDRSVTVRGITFALPDKVPMAVFLAGRLGYQAAAKGDEGAASFAMVDLAEAYVGAEQLAALFASVAAVDDGLEALRELIEAIQEEYAVTPGESSASSSS